MAKNNNEALSIQENIHEDFQKYGLPEKSAEDLSRG
jgi:hypothetical protein